jgi:hypothetical protein
VNGAYKLPDCYKKDVNSNNYKLLEISSSGVSELMVDIRAVQDSKDIRKAYGATLDRFGAMIGQPRGQLNDTQYRYLLYMRIGKNLVAGDYTSVISVIRAMFGITSTEDEIVIEDAENGNVNLRSLPLSVLVSSGFSSTQAVRLIDQLLPAGVGINTDSFEGTLEFDDDGTTYDEDRGLADLMGGIGGYLGLVLGDDDRISIMPLS